VAEREVRERERKKGKGKKRNRKGGVSRRGRAERKEVEEMDRKGKKTSGKKKEGRERKNPHITFWTNRTPTDRQRRPFLYIAGPHIAAGQLTAAKCTSYESAKIILIVAHNYT